MKSSASSMNVTPLFSRFIFLVLLPTLALVSFGVLAISNERAAVEKRFADEYGLRLRGLAEHLVSELDAVANLLPEASNKTPSLVRHSFVLQNDDFSSTPPMESEHKAALLEALNLTLLPELESQAGQESTPTLLPIAHGPAQGLYALHRTGDELRGFAFSHQALNDSIDRAASARFPSDNTRYELAGPPTDSPTSLNPIRRLYEELTSERIVAFNPSLPLPGALSDWRIELMLSGADPVGRALLRNRTIYIVTLSLMYLLIIIGVVLTLRGIWREMKLSRLKTDFVSNVSHELRTPLTSIRMFAETLREGRVQSDEEKEACLDYIVSESERLSVLTERALDWARLEAGRRQFERSTFCMEDLIRSVVKRLDSRAAHSRELRLKLSPGLPKLEGDVGALEQVLLNLLENAVKYTKPGGVIEVRLNRVGRRVQIEVEDDGIGISRAEQRRIFDRFYRADDLLARSTEGTGLGLSIALRIIRAHGGKLSVRSQPGKGTTFVVALPIPLTRLTKSD